MYHLPYEFHPKENLVCTGLPTFEQLKLMAEDGVLTAVNLRPESEDPDRDLKEEVKQVGMTYVHIPISSKTDFTRENAQQLKNVIDQTDGPVLVFCGSSNRVGGLMALKSYLFDGLSVVEALEFGESAGMTSLKPVIGQILEELAAE